MVEENYDPVSAVKNMQRDMGVVLQLHHTPFVVV
jgi:3-hydroxyisobutyrate dehydrogenase-like beta-hydroxyacid dehydrogenase